MVNTYMVIDLRKVIVPDHITKTWVDWVIGPIFHPPFVLTMKHVFL